MVSLKVMSVCRTLVIYWKTYTIYTTLDRATFHFHDLFSSTRLRKVGSEGRGKKDKSDTYNDVGIV